MVELKTRNENEYKNLTETPIGFAFTIYTIFSRGISSA